MANLGDVFNRSALSRFLNSTAGRFFRLLAGLGFLVIGYAYRSYTLGILSMAWGLFPLSSGAFDVCYISVFLGGPFSGKRIRDQYKASQK